MDGLDMAYIENTAMPNFEQMAREGFLKVVVGVFPYVTLIRSLFSKISDNIPVP